MKRQKSFYPKQTDVNKEWQIIDAGDQVLGRLASKIANILRGKEKPEYTPSVDMGDYVVVLNASKVKVTGKKMQEKIYYRHSGYPGGLKQISLEDQMAKDPCKVIYRAVWGMLPHNRMGRKMIKKVKIYAGSEHPHEAQLKSEKELACEGGLD